MKIEDAPKYPELLKKAEAMINQHEAVMDTMMIKINGEFIGYQPELAQGHKKQYVEVKKERLEEVRKAFEQAEKFLKDNNIEMMICFVSLKKGGAVVMVSENAVKKYKTEVFNKLQEIEDKYNAKVS